MTTLLSNNELTVLNENLDLFSDTPVAKATKTSHQNNKTAPTTNTKTTNPRRSAPTATKTTPSPPNTPLKLLAIKAKNPTEALQKLIERGSTVIDYAIEKRDPALKNLALTLLDQRLELQQNTLRLHWVLAEDPRNIIEIEDWDCVEFAITQAWFEEEKRRIRELKGSAYVDACTQIAKKLDRHKA